MHMFFSAKNNNTKIALRALLSTLTNVTTIQRTALSAKLPNRVTHGDRRHGIYPKEMNTLRVLYHRKHKGLPFDYSDFKMTVRKAIDGSRKIVDHEMKEEVLLRIGKLLQCQSHLTSCWSMVCLDMKEWIPTFWRSEEVFLN